MAISVGGAGRVSGPGGAPVAQRASLAAVLVVLPGMLALLEFASSRTDLKMLLFPPVAAIGYQILRTPRSPLAHLRSVVLAPTLASLVGTGLAAAGGLQVWTTVAATLAAADSGRRSPPPVHPTELDLSRVGAPGDHGPLRRLSGLATRLRPALGHTGRRRARLRGHNSGHSFGTKW